MVSNVTEVTNNDPVFTANCVRGCHKFKPHSARRMASLKASGGNCRGLNTEADCKIGVNIQH